MVKFNAEGEISDCMESDDERYDPLKNIPYKSLEELGLERPTLYQRIHTYSAMKIIPIYLTLLHRLKGK